MSRFYLSETTADFVDLFLVGDGEKALPELVQKYIECKQKGITTKEAFLKAAGTGLAGPFALCEIEAVRLESGAPEYRFSGGSAQWMDEHHLRAKLSLSHDGGMALAFCILETET